MIIHDRSTPLVNDAQDDEGTQCVRRQTIVEGAGIAMATFEENERARATLNSIGDAVIGTDVLGRVTYLNAVAASLTGWSREHAAGMRRRRCSRSSTRLRAKLSRVLLRWQCAKTRP